MRKVQCIICDTEVFIDENTLEAKRLKTIQCILLCVMNVKVDSIHLNIAIKHRHIIIVKVSSIIISIATSKSSPRDRYTDNQFQNIKEKPNAIV